MTYQREQLGRMNGLRHYVELMPVQFCLFEQVRRGYLARKQGESPVWVFCLQAKSEVDSVHPWQRNIDQLTAQRAFSERQGSKHSSAECQCSTGRWWLWRMQAVRGPGRPRLAWAKRSRSVTSTWRKRSICLSAMIFCAAALTCSRLFRRERGEPTRAARSWSALSAAAMRCSRAARSRVSFWELKYQRARKPWAVRSGCLRIGGAVLRGLTLASTTGPHAATLPLPMPTCASGGRCSWNSKSIAPHPPCFDFKPA
jgi:hypothetical protein